MSRRPDHRHVVLAAAASLAVAAALAASALAGDPAAGKQLFASAGCGSCHVLRAAGATGTSGPDLDRLQPAYLTIVNAVTNGGDHMPAFGGTLTAGQIADLATFVYDATQVSAAPAKVSVQAGRPTEFAFTLSRRSVPVGTTAFTIANRGKLTHTFKVCSSAKGGRGNACAGTGTRPIPPGRTATLTVTFTRKGSYEYLCTIPSHAAAGMKGLLTVR